MHSTWKTRNWYVSPYNYVREVRAGINAPENIEIHDTTLRDGQECAGVVLGKPEKLRIAKALDDFGIRRIEAGVYISPDDPITLKAIAHAGLEAKIFAFCRAYEEGYSHIDIARKCDISHVTLNMPSSTVRIEKGLKKTQDWAIGKSIDAISYAKDHGMYVDFFLPDTFRAGWEFLEHLILVAKQCHIDSLTLVDSSGVAIPQAVMYLVRKVKQLISAPIEVHCHNDYGLALANALAGYCAGAEVVHTTVNGLGLRCGNTPLEQFVMCIRALHGVDLSLRYSKLYNLCKLVEKLCEMPVSTLQPISGHSAFALEQLGLMERLQEESELPAFFPYLPDFVGQKVRVILSKWSDTTSVKFKLKQMGLTANERQIGKLLPAVRNLSLRKRRPVTDYEFEKLVTQSRSTSKDP